MYKNVDSEIVERLGQIVGADNVLVEANDMEPYSHDEVVGLRADPEVVVRATSTEQVSLILKLAQRERIPVTPRGAGDGAERRRGAYLRRDHPPPGKDDPHPGD